MPNAKFEPSKIVKRGQLSSNSFVSPASEKNARETLKSFWEHNTQTHNTLRKKSQSSRERYFFVVKRAQKRAQFVARAGKSRDSIRRFPRTSDWFKPFELDLKRTAKTLEKRKWRIKGTRDRFSREHVLYSSRGKVVAFVSTAFRRGSALCARLVVILKSSNHGEKRVR